MKDFHPDDSEFLVFISFFPVGVIGVIASAYANFLLANWLFVPMMIIGAMRMWHGRR
jgi:hypothetical protein